MRNPIERYIEDVVVYADLAANDERTLRGELKEHLTSLLADRASTNPKETYAMIENEFGKASQIGKAVARAKGRVRTYFRKKMRTWSIGVPIALVLGLFVRFAVAQPFIVPGDAVSPEIPRGSRIMVYKLARSFVPGDIVVFQNSDRLYRLGIVLSADSTQIVVKKTGVPNMTVPLDHVVGRVFLNTR
jgi:hypothetical protein